MTVLFISPVPKVSAQGRDKQTYSFYDSTIGQVKSSGKLIGNTRAKDAQVVLKFTPNFDTLEYKTGLDEKILNPYKGNTEMGFPENIVNQEYITLQTFYEIQDGVPFGTYTSKMKSNANIFNFSFLNKNAEQWTLNDSKELFNSAIELSLEERFDFIGEIAKELRVYRDLFTYLSDKYKELQEPYKIIKSNLEANCFSHSKKGDIKEATAIMNLKSNYNWTDRTTNTHTITEQPLFPDVPKNNGNK